MTVALDILDVAVLVLLAGGVILFLTELARAVRGEYRAAMRTRSRVREPFTEARRENATRRLRGDAP